MGLVPGDTALLASPQQTGQWPASASPFYNLSGEQIPEQTYLERVYQTNDGQSWETLPPLPAPGTSAKRMGLLQVLATLDDGRLLAFGIDPQTGLPPSSGTNIVSAFWLWLWNPISLHWQVLSAPLNQPADEGCGLCWSAFISTSTEHVTYLYAYHSGTIDSSPANKASQAIFRVRLP
jgi:hypothetical protein